MNTTHDRLNHLVAGLTVLSQKSRLCHWNVEGPGFLDLHEFFGGYYDLLSDEVDTFAERIRALGQYPMGTLAGYLAETQITEVATIDSRDMVSILLADTEHLISELRSWIEVETDLPTQDLFI